MLKKVNFYTQFAEETMSQQGDVCYTFEAALEMAINMENDGFRGYIDALRIVKSKQARELLKEAALDELAHKYELEKALIDGHTAEGALEKPLPTMNLDAVLAKRELTPNSDVREALAYSIHMEHSAIAFYRKMAAACAGAPMAKLMERLVADESRHLQQLEDMYEDHYMTEN
ncbi:MAG: ferritin family protein [Geobacteraceae bacterium]|nr:ferritin family protein [Geobacteraceae bacterium]